MLVYLELRDGNLVIPRKEFDNIMDFDWFLGFLVKTHFDGNDTEELSKYSLWESKNVVLSIFDSLRYNRLIIYENNLEYFLSVAEKWCAPEWLVDAIKNRKNNVNDVHSVLTEASTTLDGGIKKCLNCSIGYNPLDNSSTSCKFHSYSLSFRIEDNSCYTCCGYRPYKDYEDHIYSCGCKIGYHICSN